MKRYKKFFLKRTFLNWRDCIITKSVNSKFNKLYQNKLEDMKINYSSIINDLKKKILLTEKNISLVEQKHSEFSFVFSKNLTQAVSNLNKEILNLQNDDLQNFKNTDKINSFKIVKNLDNEFKEKMGKNFYLENKYKKTEKIFKN